jgi:multidrug efflux pump
MMRCRTSQQKLLQVQGVGNVELGGAALPAVRIEINPVRCAAGISLEDVRTALQSSSANRPRGAIEGIDISTAGWPGRSMPARPR